MCLEPAVNGSLITGHLQYLRQTLPNELPVDLPVNLDSLFSHLVSQYLSSILFPLIPRRPKYRQTDKHLVLSDETFDTLRLETTS
jgi:hypothetical protein